MERGTPEVVTAYTDGGCIGNPGPGAWAFVINWNGEALQGVGHEKATTNNRMELTAVLEVLKEILSRRDLARSKVDLHTDSQYVKKGITEWIYRWERNGWKTSAKKPVKNEDLWHELRRLSRGLSVQWKWIRGHEGIEGNELCDRLVKEEMKKLVRMK
jgi:ribonuclease HI